MTADPTVSTSWSVATSRVLESLHLELKQAAADIEQALQQDDAIVMAGLARRLARMRNALLMIRKPAIAWVAGEVQAVIEAAAAGTLDQRVGISDRERARILVDAIDTLDTAVASLDESARNDTALPWLDRVNDMRALRGEDLVGDALVLGLDIDVDAHLEADQSSVQSFADEQEWTQLCRQQRPRVVRSLVDWFKATSNNDDSARMHALSTMRTCLQPLVDSEDAPRADALVFRTASRIVASLADGSLEDTGSARRLMAQVERRLHDGTEVQTLPLLRNLLYYVALAGRRVESRDAVLEQLFDLDSVRLAIAESASWRHAAPALSRRLSDGIHARSIELLHPIESWLEAGAHGLDKRARDLLLGRLRELDALLTVFGEDEARKTVSVAADRIAAMQTGHSPDTSSRLALASDLLRLRKCLEDGRLQSGRVRPALERAPDAADEGLSTVSSESRTLARRIEQTGNPISSERSSDIDTAQAALVNEARHQLKELEPSLEGLLGNDVASAQPLDAVLVRLKQMSAALGILPLPEASALLDGLADTLELGAPSSDHRFRDAIARLVVEMDACLEAALQPQQASNDALERAESALTDVRSALPGTRLFDTVLAGADTRTTHQAPQQNTQQAESHAHADDPDARALTDAALVSLDGFVTGMSCMPVTAAPLIEPLRTLERIGRRAGHEALSRVCGAALDRLDSKADGVPEEQLHELHAVLPQLIADIEAPAGSAGNVAVDELVAELALPREQQGETTERRADPTLEQVFVVECEGHLRVIESELAAAPSVPGQRMLRALHTIDGSAQTVGAADIVTAIGPLQALAEDHYQHGRALDEKDIGTFESGVARIRACLDSASLAPVFADRMSSSEGEDDDEGMLDTGGVALADVFADEAQELIARLRPRSDHGESDTRSDALSALHTLKGSARVAGWPGLAELAHEHEASIQGVSPKGLAQAIEQARRELDAASPGRLAGAAPHDQIIATGDTRVTEDAWERLLGLASELTTSQARLTVEIDRLTHMARELETVAHRWRRLPNASDLLESEAARELIADVATMRDTLEAAVRGVDTERRHGARSARALQQDLVRARLVRFGDTVPRLQDVLNDAAAVCDVQVALQVTGEDLTLDGALCRRLLPAIEHVLRNAVAHGLESVSERESHGKSGVGTVCVDAALDGVDLVVRVSDDGRGLAAGLESLAQIEQTGFSTARSGDSSREQLAGHGLGLASVRRVLTDLDGDLRLVDTPVGACFELRVPQRVPVQQVVLVQAGSMCVGISVNHVRDVLPFDATVPAIELSACLGAEPASVDDHNQRRLLILASHGEEVCVSVDAVAGYQELVVQALGPQLARLGYYSGAAGLGDGRIAFLLAPSAWRTVADPGASASVGAPGTTAQEAIRQSNSVAAARVLVIDDSPTQRAWLQEQLGAWNMDVTEAHDGQRGLDILKTAAFDLILLDIDMPRVDGYGVLEALRETPTLASNAPVLMLTSRTSTRDREAALALGASGMLAKPVSSADLQTALDAALDTSVSPS